MALKTRTTFRNLALAGCATLALAAAAMAQPAKPIHFNIPAEDLGAALNQLAQQSQMEIVFNADVARGKRAEALTGDYTPQEALTRLLRGSGLQSRLTGAGFFAVEPFTPPGAGSRGDQRGADSANVGGVVVIARRTVDTPAEQIKRVSPGISDSITARDVENTTGMTLADALDRVVGVSSDKFYGTSDGGYVSIRAFDSRYNSMDIDGNPIWFSSQNNRGAQIGMFPSSILKETTVYKTVTPDEDGNSIGGHISLRTLRAFDGGDQPYLSLGALVGGYEQSGVVDGGPSGRVYGAGKTTFGDDHQYGVVLGFNAQRQRSHDRYGGVDTYAQVNGQDWVNANLYSNGIYDKDVENAVGYAKFEMRQADKLYAFVSTSLFDDARRQYLDREGDYIYATSGRTTNFSDGTADFSKAVGYTKEYDYNIERQAQMIGAGADYQATAQGVLSVRANYTNFTNSIITRYPETFMLSNLSGSYDLGGDLPTASVSNPAIYDNPANWINRNTTASYVRNQMLHDKVTSLRADFSQNTFASAQGLGVEAGVAWTRLDRSFLQPQDNYLLPKGTTLTLAQVAAPGATMADNAALQMNWNTFWNYVYAHGIDSYSNGFGANYKLVEDVLAAHTEVYFSGDRYRVLAGVRYESTRDADNTGNTVNGVDLPYNWANSYGNWMPNVQGSYDLTDHLKLRAAFTKTIGRPDFSDFAPGQTRSLDANGNLVISGSNPKLGPRLSTNYDLSVEYYKGDSFVSLALFHKDLAHETFNQTISVVDSGTGPVTQTVPLNTGHANVNGVELSLAKRRLDLLPGPLKRLGVSANFTYLDGHWTIIQTDGETRTIDALRNQPKYLANLDVSYDLGPADLHLDYRARGRAFTTTFGATPAGDQWIRPNDQLDALANLRIGHGLELTAEARNLTNSYWVITTGQTNAIYNSVGGGRSYFAGVKYHY